MMLTPTSFAEAFLNLVSDDHLKNLSNEIQRDGRRRIAQERYSEVFCGQWRRPHVADDTTTVGLFSFSSLLVFDPNT